MASFPNSPSFVFADVAVHAALLIALTTLPTVATLFSSPLLASTVPGLSPVVTLLIVPVLTFTPASSTTKELSAGFTEIVFPVSSFCKPLPRFTLYFTVDILPSVLATVAVVPSPSMKFTVSYAFTKSTSVPLPCKFQPAFNTSDTVAALFGLIYLSPSLFVIFGAP